MVMKYNIIQKNHQREKIWILDNGIYHVWRDSLIIATDFILSQYKDILTIQQTLAFFDYTSRVTLDTYICNLTETILYYLVTLSKF